MRVTETQSPPRTEYIDLWERGLDPWHADAFPDKHKSAGTEGPRKSGWYAIDYYGNVIGFIANGTDTSYYEGLESTIKIIGSEG